MVPSPLFHHGKFPDLQSTPISLMEDAYLDNLSHGILCNYHLAGDLMIKNNSPLATSTKMTNSKADCQHRTCVTDIAN